MLLFNRRESLGPIKSDKKATDRRLVQLNLKSVPASIKNYVVSESAAKKRKKKKYTDTDCDSPIGAHDTTGDLRLIHEGIADLIKTEKQM